MATGGTIEYGIKFNVDSGSLNQLKKELQAIQDMTTSQYQKINPNASANLTKAKDELVALKKEVAEIEKIFNKAYNIKLDATNIAQVRKELSNFGVDKLANTFSQLGAQGAAAFRKIATEITLVKAPLKETNKLLDKMAESFGNTVRWGITSSLWNNITGSINKAWQYSKNLDASLNDIRVVTGQSADQMDRLAKNANRTAQALGNTTLDYTKAALIYYQQGLSDAEVEARTNVTLKLANVLNASAQEVSDYMTAIWNNFDKGSGSLEHFADVITALGAATAASSEEIATGLEKFASVANTVGLSYEYATTALATVVAQTRQSADTVGTAFKTLFARIQDLELGNTLDDGTTLGKYAEALQKVGINIKDSSGELKNMDTILAEMGAKWNSLNKAQQVALAQNVAGTRQYTYLVALMDNWDKFETNLTVAANSTGTLQRQQEIYMESTEAHLNKLTASIERFMDALINNKTINVLIDGLTSIVNLFNNFIESIGGGGNALLLLGSIAMQVFNTQIAQGLVQVSSKMKEIQGELANIKFTGEIEKLIKEFEKMAPTTWTKQFISDLEEILKIYDSLTTKQKEMIKEQIVLYNDAIKEQEEDIDIAKNNLNIITKFRASSGLATESNYNDYGDDQYQRDLKLLEGEFAGDENAARASAIKFSNTVSRFYELINNETEINSEEGRENLKQSFITYYHDLEAAIEALDRNFGELIAEKDPQMKEKLQSIFGLLGGSGNGVKNPVIKSQDDDQFVEYTQEAKNLAKELYVLKDIGTFAADSVGNALEGFKSGTIQNEIKKSDNIITRIRKNIFDLVEEGKKVDFTTNFVNLSSGIGQVAAGVRSAINLFSIWENESLSTGEKVLQTFTSVSTAIPMLINGITLIKDSWKVLIPLAKKVGAAMYESLGPYGIALVAIVIAIGAVIYAYNNWFSKEKQLQQELNKSQEAASKAANAYTELSNTVSNYQSAQDGLNGLTEGTIEFYNQIVKANEEAQKLIETLHLVAGIDYTVGNNGLIKIDEKGLTKAMAQEQKKVFQAQARVNQAQIAQLEYERKQIVSNAQYAINTKNGFRAGFSYSQTESVLNKDIEKQMQNGKANLNSIGPSNWISDIQYVAGKTLENPLRTLIGPINNTWLGILDILQQQTDITKKGQVDITKEVGLFRSQYDVKTAEILAYQTQLAESLIRGYGSDSDIEWYNDLLDSEKGIVQKSFAIAQTEDQLKVQENLQSGWGEFWDTSSDDLLATTGKVLLGVVTDALTFGATGRTGKYLWGQNQEEGKLTNQELKERYATNVLGATKIGDNYVYADGKKVDFSQIDLETAKQTYISSGGYKAAQNLTDLRWEINRNIGIAENLGANTKEAKNIGMAYTNLQQGATKGTDWAALTDKEMYILEREVAIRMEAEGIVDENGRILEGQGEAALKWASMMKEIHDLRNSLTEEELANAQYLKNLEEYNELMASNATELGTSTEALKLYDAALQNADKGFVEYNEETAKAAAASYKFNKIYNEGRAAFEKNEDAFDAYVDSLKNGTKISYDVADGAGEIIKSLKGMGIELSTTQLTDQNLLSNIKKLLSGTEEEAEKAFKVLQRASWAEALKNNFNIAETAIEGVLDKLEKLEDGQEISLGELGLGPLEGTISEIQSKLDSVGIHLSEKDLENMVEEIDTAADGGTVGVTEGDIKANGSSTKTVTIASDDGNGLLDGTYTWTETTNSDDKIFALGANKKFTYTKSAINLASSLSSGSKSKKSKQEKSDDKFDRYHQVNTQIAKIEKSLQRLENTQKKVLGSDLLKNLNNQWKNLNTQIKNYNDKLKIANQEQDELKKKLSKQGVKFNSDGTVSNYLTALENAQKEYNKAVDKYNKSKQKDSDKKKLDAAKKKYEEFKTDIDRYDELVSSFIPEILQQIRDAWDKQVEASLEQFHVGIDLAVDIKDIKLNWADFKSKIVNQLQDSDILGNIDLSKERTAANMENAEARRKQLTTAMNELQRNLAGNANLTGDDRQKALQEVKDNYEAAIELYTELAEERNNAEKLYQQALEQEKQAIQDQLDLYNKINDQLEHDKKLVELVYGTKAYDKLVKYDKQQDANNKEQLKVYKAQEEVMKRRFEEAQAERDRTKAAMDGLTQGTDEWQIANSEFIKASENLTNAQANYEDALTQANNALEKSIESLHKTLEDQAADLAQGYGQQVTGSAGGLEYAQDEWDLINKHADQYLDTINRLSGENQLESKYLESIEKATSPSVQKKLKDAMDSEMKYLREKDKLSQYDLDRANKKLQVTLAEIALEEAQDNKSRMRLRRDSQGNYRYQYVADEAEIQKAEEDLQKARDDLYNFDKERMKTTHNDILALEKEFRDKLKEIETNSEYSEEERAERLKLIYDEYYGEGGYLPQAYELANTARENVTESAFEDLAALQGKTLEDFTSLTEAEQDAIMTGLIPAWDSVASHMAEAGAQAELMLEYMNELKNIRREYQDNVAEDLLASGQSTEDLANGLDEKANDIQDLITPITQVVNEQNEIVSAAKAWTDEINIQIEKLKDLLAAIEEAKNALLEFEEDELEKVGIATGYNRNDSHYKFTDTVKSSSDFSQNSDFQQFLSLKNYHLENGVTEAIKEFQRDLGFTGAAVNGIANKTLWTAAKMAGFSSGGYTGDWGSSEGKIGILHEKELVLNADDTKNLLSMIEIVRDNLYRSQIQALQSTYRNAIGGIVGSSGEFDQNVNINATFPNVSSSYEIEEALKNLVNAAAQRRRKLNKN